MVDIKRIVENFLIDGQFESSECYGMGHINDTFAVTYRMNAGQNKRFIFQRVNHNIFNEPEKLMQNVENVTKYLRETIIKDGGDPERETLNLIPTKDRCYYKDSENDVWRGYLFIEDATSYQFVEKPEHFYSAGKAFGKFQKMLAGYPAGTLHETIKDFHNTKKRLERFIEVLDRDENNRAHLVGNEIDFVLKRADQASTLVDLYEKGLLPLRVTHNDTKLNNVMIDNSTGQGLCVIDLDTVLPGLSLYDFGDAIRFGANPAAEDERDLSKVRMELSLFDEFSHGFLEEASESLNSKEIEFLPMSAKIMTYECGMRFLADYIQGDIYFKIHCDNHNLDRARTQFKMVEDMETKMDAMSKIVAKYI